MAIEWEHDDMTTGNRYLPDRIDGDTDDLTPELRSILSWFEFEHLPEGPMREASSIICNHARYLAIALPDGDELRVGMRKLLEAKDCFVRAAKSIPPTPPQ